MRSVNIESAVITGVYLEKLVHMTSRSLRRL
jgi:hypothetical protein